jgi:sulfite exporter TauE/SafE
MAATTGNAAGGVAVMFAFWLGTLPALLLAGTGAERLRDIQGNRTFRRIAGVVVVVIGLFALMPVARMLPAVI